MAEVTTSSRPSQQQRIADLKNARRDLDALEVLLHETAEAIGGALGNAAGALTNAAYKTAEARMWIGRALANLGESDTSEDHDKATEPRIKVAPARREGPVKTSDTEEEGGK